MIKGRNYSYSVPCLKLVSDQQELEELVEVKTRTLNPDHHGRTTEAVCW